MRNRMRFGYVAAAVLLGVLAGCGKGNLSTPQDAAKTFARAIGSGDAETAKKASTGIDPKVIDAMAAMSLNMKKMRDAAAAKFGDDGKNITFGSAEDPAEMVKSIENADVKTSGDTATITPKEGGRPFQVKKVDGEWKVDMSEMNGMMSTMGTGMFDSMGKAASQTADDINAGKFKTATEARQAFAMKMMGGLGK